MELVYNEETQKWEQKPEPFTTIVCETEEDFEIIGAAVAFYSKHLEEQGKPQTNADRIRAMSDDELAEWIARTQIRVVKDAMTILWLPCAEGDEIVEIWKTEELEWLKQPAEG